jgi:hypothetical protein
MTAAFSFGFAGDDIDEDRPAEIDRGTNLQDSNVIYTISLPAKRHSLENLVSNTAMQVLIFPQLIRSVDLTATMA